MAKEVNDNLILKELNEQAVKIATDLKSITDAEKRKAKFNELVELNNEIRRIEANTRENRKLEISDRESCCNDFNESVRRDVERDKTKSENLKTFVSAGISLLSLIGTGVMFFKAVKTEKQMDDEGEIPTTMRQKLALNSGLNNGLRRN